MLLNFKRTHHTLQHYTWKRYGAFFLDCSEHVTVQPVM